jgi:hypothetical protein
MTKREATQKSMNKTLTGDFCRLKSSAHITRGIRTPRNMSRPGGMTKVFYCDLETRQVRYYLRPQAKRGKVSGFSRKSRNRLISRLDSYAIPASGFITFTMPGRGWESCPAAYDPRSWKNDLDIFRKRLSRAFPVSHATWKLEPQKRGAPHYHLLFWSGMIFWPPAKRLQLAEWCRVTWCSICSKHCLSSEQRQNHWVHGVDVKWFDECSKKEVMRYVGKYVGKVVSGEFSEAWGFPGRWWGEINKQNRPPVVHREIELTTDEYHALRRLVTRWVRSRERSQGNKPSFSRRLRKWSSFLVHVPFNVIVSMLEFIRGGPIVFDVTYVYPVNDHWMSWPRNRHGYERFFEAYSGGQCHEFPVVAPF